MNREHISNKRRGNSICSRTSNALKDPCNEKGLIRRRKCTPQSAERENCRGDDEDRSSAHPVGQGNPPDISRTEHENVYL
jgi:hypothetical protein